MTDRTRPGPRERLLATAEQLTYAEGLNVGVDALLRDANVARRSLYEHFGGKDGLLVEVLRRSTEADLRRYREVMDAAGTDPRDRLLAIFDDLETVTSGPEFRGCRYLAADLALPRAQHPVHAVSAAYRAKVHELLRAECDALGRDDADELADRIHLLIEGVLASAAFGAIDQPARTARGIVAEAIVPGRVAGSGS
jgi:AcrR family transcriptional regulator